jgi:hypothetical protein
MEFKCCPMNSGAAREFIPPASVQPIETSCNAVREWVSFHSCPAMAKGKRIAYQPPIQKDNYRTKNYPELNRLDFRNYG